MKLLSIIFPAGVLFIIRRPGLGATALIAQATFFLWPLATILALAALAQHNSELARSYNFTYRPM